MNKTNVAISLNEQLLNRIDRLVRERVFPNRNRAIEIAIEEKMSRLERSRLAEECTKLDPSFERSLAETGFATELEQWPEY